MKRWMLFIACLGSLMSSVEVKAQSEEERRLIAASQADASPLYFNPDVKEVSDIKQGNFRNEKECIIRGGLPNFFARLQAGKPVTIGYIGGSITQGNVCYRPQSAKFISSMFPGVKKTWLNAGVSGTGTDLGACRIHQQLLKHNPDLVFVEFAVNGAYAPGMEGIVRQIVRFNPHVDICFIYTLLNGQTVAYQQNRIPANIEGLEKIAEHYQLPSIHMGMEAAQLEKENKLVWKGIADTANGRILFSNDGIHPLQAGGDLYAAAIARSFVKMNKPVVAVSHQLPDALIADNWEDGTMVDPLAIATFDDQWTQVKTAGSDLKQYAGWFPYIMKADTPGASFSFKFKGTMFGFFNIGGPEVGQLSVSVDGKPVKLQVIAASGYRLQKASSEKGNEVIDLFNSYCNNRYRGQYDLVQVPDGEHEVTIAISPLKADKRAILGAKQLQDITAHPDKYDQTVFYLGKVLLKGTPITPAKAKLTQKEKWELKLQRYAKQDAAAFPAPNGILFTGSSTIENWKSVQADFPGKPIISRGISGTRVNDLLNYADQVITPYKARQIFIYEGDNDLGLKRTPQQVIADFEQLFNKVRRDNKKAEIIFISIKPSPRRLKDTAKIQEANRLVKLFLEKKKNTGYIDIYNAMLSSGKELVPAYYREDGLHLTEEGYRVWAATIKPFVK